MHTTIQTSVENLGHTKEFVSAGVTQLAAIALLGVGVDLTQYPDHVVERMTPAQMIYIGIGETAHRGNVLAEFIKDVKDSMVLPRSQSEVGIGFFRRAISYLTTLDSDHTNPRIEEPEVMLPFEYKPRSDEQVQMDEAEMKHNLYNIVDISASLC